MYRITARVLLQLSITRYLPHLLPFLPCVKKCEMEILIANGKTIWWSIYGSSKKTLSSFIFVFYLFGFKIMHYLCVKYDFYNLYGSSGAIFIRLGAMVGMPHFKISNRMYTYLAHFGLLGCRIGGTAGKSPPPIQ
jgi:hypothetical protein